MISGASAPVCLANEFLSVRIDAANASFAVTDQRNGMQWKSGPVFLNMWVRDVILNRQLCCLCQKGGHWNIRQKSLPAGMAALECEHPDSGISFNIEFLLKGGSVEIRIPISTLREVKPCVHQLSRVEIFPEFAAVPQGTAGYLVLPNAGGVTIAYTNSDAGSIAQTGSMEKPCVADQLADGRVDGPVTYSSKVFAEQASVEDLPHLPLYGMVVNKAAYAAIIMDGRHDSEIVLRARQGRQNRFSLNASFTFRDTCHDELDAVDRSMRYVFLTGAEANYSGIARTYREYLIKEQGVPTLAQRAKANPDVDRLTRSFISKLTMGFKKYPARNEPEHYSPVADGHCELMVFYTYDSAMKLCRKLYDLGIDSAWMNITGFNTEGHDGLYPTIFPIEERFGGEAGFKRFMAFARELGYMASVHVNYRDSYRISPDFSEASLLQGPGGRFTKGNFWPAGQSHEVCPKAVMNGTIKRDLPRLHELNLTGPFYIDNVLGVLQSCYAPEHRCNRRQYAEAIREYIAYARKLFGSIANEMVSPDILDLADIAIELPFPRGLADHYLCSSPLKRLGLACEGVPLNQMVYHGLICYCLSYSAFEMKPDYLLHALEAGALPRYDLRDNAPEAHLDTIVEMYNVCCKQLGHLQKEFMDSHEKLDDGLYLTVYSNGQKLVVNYTDKIRQWRGHEVLPKSFLHLQDVSVHSCVK